MSRAARSQPRGPRAAMATPFTPMVPSPYVVTPVARVDPSDRYELVKRLAVGGMAEIWLAKMRGIEGFERQVVVKSMLPHLAEEDQYVKMFLEEARLGATLFHRTSRKLSLSDSGRTERSTWDFSSRMSSAANDAAIEVTELAMRVCGGAAFRVSWENATGDRVWLTSVDSLQAIVISSGQFRSGASLSSILI